MEKKHLSEVGKIIVTTVINNLSARENETLNENEVAYINGLIDMAFVCKKISVEENGFLEEFLKFIS